MGYFPAFLRFDDKKVLLIGGGAVAYEKLLHLLDFTKNISVISLDVCANIQAVIESNDLTYHDRAYKRGDIASYDIVVVAVNDISLQTDIYIESREYRCLCNFVDLPQNCDFTFGSYIKKDDLVVAISTSGVSPALAKQLKLYLQDFIPSSIIKFLEEMRHLRETLPKGKERMELLSQKAKEYINNLKNQNPEHNK